MDAFDAAARAPSRTTVPETEAGAHPSKERLEPAPPFAGANAGDVMRAGASGVAVIGAIFDAEDARAAAAALRAAMRAGVRP